jgi:hypothetical protein
MLSYFGDARLVPDPALSNRLVVVLGDTFPGAITVPTTTTVPAPAAGPVAPSETTVAAPPEVTATTDPNAVVCS